MRDLLLLDGISGVSLGREITEAFEQIGLTVTYADLRKLRSRKFYT